ncbi:class I SAM-dependent methyltransferase [Coleofasciculus sp. FACHB-64]|uniref:class I SAM-dependent methyltransferase n=1 Tax=Cyanophyceae TaxID=3028117 RepID=UPI001688603E|nr:MULTISPECIES: class I SAM-dependent methyltransferase [unclassified Coleofasciculus]MBD1840927.1 class I SAM-dependent methyltransferase [Coleofasciculus sp. FACHB-501]MBD1889381.1 class I SAM-dependent methyltransferase [Coleofasciculus sp. FACHB-SPT9]MBD2046050.1 class I SAM-dependent methyltransferase [Coleofasciculus sp. FACHB-64]
MATILQRYQYPYQDSNLTNAHGFLMPPLLSIIQNNKNTDDKKKLRILDLGAGNGSLSHAIAQKGYEVVGVEESEQGFSIAQHNFSDCHFIQASIYDLPYAELENSFDIVISVEVIEHLLYPRELVKAANKCLKPNGTLILTTPYHGYIKNIVLSLSGRMDKHFHVLWDGGHIKFFSVKTLTELLKSEGYTDIHFKFAGRFPYVWKSMLCSCSPMRQET